MASTIDWCEPNYTWTDYVAEMGNTLSSLTLSLVGFYMWRNYVNVPLPRTIRWSHYLSIIIGIGSAWFHATLSYTGQLVDELSMLWLMTLSLPTFLGENKLLCYTLYLMTLWYTVLSFTVEVVPTTQYVVFQTFFGTMVALVAIKIYTTMLNSRRLVLNTIASFTCALGFWLCDFYLCEVIGHWYLHTGWHLVVSCTLYYYLSLQMVHHFATKHLR
jgi:hypothetical protein